MSRYDIEAAMHRLQRLGVDTDNFQQDYNKIPIENIDLSKVEKAAPINKKVVSKHTIIIDSRQRNYSIYPDANNYLVELMEAHKNVERIELIAAIMPKTEYNVNSENNLLIVTITGIVKQLRLTDGQYFIGSNVIGSPNYISDGNVPVSGLIAEVVNILNTHPNSGNAFNAFLATTPYINGGTGQNASPLNRVIITNSSINFSIDFTNNTFTSGSPFRLLGFKKQIYTSNTLNVIYGSSNTGICIPADLTTPNLHVVNINSIASIYDYDMLDDPKYIIMQVEFGNKSADRIESIDIANNHKFAAVIYDNNESDTISTYSTTSPTGNIQLQQFRPPGRLKALKGQDFDKKIITFDPPFTLDNFKFSFYKYDNTFYQFHNREHLLTFEIDVADFDPKYRY